MKLKPLKSLQKDSAAVRAYVNAVVEGQNIKPSSNESLKNKIVPRVKKMFEDEKRSIAKAIKQQKKQQAGLEAISVTKGIFPPK